MYSETGVFLMRLKKLTIIGFKSFAEKTILHFHAGITCIVGPNGCGKSNIADAFRWVLGEQSAKSMRGNKMPDVIFAGTNQRKPFHFAEVSLTLTDIQGALPIEDQELTLTRRLHRTGESEYFLNGNSIRLKEVQNLFLDSGIGRHAFSIFEQGKIDQIIQDTPLERRYIFEEAAGILRFLQRKQEALKRLEEADLNLDRVRDIHREVEQQTIILKEQAEKAQQFKEHQALLDKLERANYILRWNLLEKKWNETEKRQQQLKMHLAEMNAIMDQLQAKYQERRVLIQQQEKSLRTKSEELYQIRSEKEIHLREYQSHQEYLKETQQKEKKLKLELEELHLSHQTYQKALQDIFHQQTRIDLEFQESENQLAVQHDKVQLKEKEVLQLRNHLNAKQQQRLKFMQNESQMESEWKQNEVRLENNQERKKQLDECQNRLVEDLKQYTQLIQEKSQHLHRISSSIDTHQDRLEAYEEEIKKSSQEIEKKHKEIETCRRKMMEQKARQKVLLRMQEEYEGFSPGSKKLLQEAYQAQSILFNKIRPLYEFLNPQSDDVGALTTILRTYTQTLVVETETDFKVVLDFAQQHDIQDYSLFCMDWMKTEKTIFKQKKRQFNKKIASNDVLEHFLRNVEEVQDHIEALTLLRETAYSGEVWSQQGAFFDRYQVFFSINPHENHIFLRESELKKLEEELNEKEEQLKNLDKHLQYLDQHRTKQQLERAEVDKMLRRDEMKLVEVNLVLQRLLKDQEKMKAEQEQIQKELTDLEKQTELQHSFVRQLQDKHAVARQDLTHLHQEVEELEKELETQDRSLQTQQKDQKNKSNYYQKLTDEKRQLLHQTQLLEAKEQDRQKRENRFEEELTYMEELQLKTRVKGIQCSQFLEAIEGRLQESTAACLHLEKEKEINQEFLYQIDQEMAQQLNHIKKGEEESHLLSIQLAQHRSAAQSLENELQERHHLTIAEAKQRETPVIQSLEQTEKQIRSLRQTLQAAGNINLASIEELEKHQIRYNFLQQQMKDMIESKQELLQMITQLDTQSCQIFRKTFEAIRYNFQKNFQILFSGGETDLQFTETENILEAGIEIMARPPGKQMRSITLLSGGEKCLTALALLFAIFEIKSVPFCILDEIDAPLDDTNVERFVNMVKHFVDRSQFLIITHNKRTMAAADVLFGVSMEEKGISKLISLEFSQESSIPEASLI